MGDLDDPSDSDLSLVLLKEEVEALAEAFRDEDKVPVRTALTWNNTRNIYKS